MLFKAMRLDGGSSEGRGLGCAKTGAAVRATPEERGTAVRVTPEETLRSKSLSSQLPSLCVLTKFTTCRDRPNSVAVSHTLDLPCLGLVAVSPTDEADDLGDDR